MAKALIPLAHTTLGASAATVTFSSIDQSYKDLVLVMNTLDVSGAGTVPVINFNSGATANYSYVSMNGAGSGTSSKVTSGTAGTMGQIGSSNVGNVATIFDYSATDKHKTILLRKSAADEIVAMRWGSTAAITSIQLSVPSDSFASGSTFALYGVIA